MYEKPDPGKVFVGDPSLASKRSLHHARHRVRDMPLTKQDFRDFAITESGCPRCDWALAHGLDGNHPNVSMPHSSECRARMKAAIAASGPAGKKRIEDNDRRVEMAKEALGKPGEEVEDTGGGEPPSFPAPKVEFVPMPSSEVDNPKAEKADKQEEERRWEGRGRRQEDGRGGREDVGNRSARRHNPKP